MFMSKANHAGEYPEAAQRNLLLAAKCMRLFITQLDCLQRLRGKVAQQHVEVKHVHINGGGQAIVGAVTTASVHAKEGG
jgi:hypothetical protein